MMIHPLMLYTGMVGFVVPFAFAFAALASGELGTSWFRTTRRWTLFPWLFLSIGILLGGRWAYEVLGWGGYWAWDPVENASFMPWLPATAYLHSVMIQEKRDMLKTWNLLLIGLTYTLCLFGTFLTRSGVVQSVHAFAQTPLFVSVFLGYVLVTAAVFLAALWLRREGIRSEGRLESVVSREASFLLNNWVFIAILMVVFWGTMFPVFSEAITGNRIAVGPVFFNTMAGPLALLLLFLTGVGPLIAWRRASIANLRRQFVWPSTAGIVTAAALLAAFRGRLDFYALDGLEPGGLRGRHDRAGVRPGGPRAHPQRRGERPPGARLPAAEEPAALRRLHRPSRRRVRADRNHRLGPQPGEPRERPAGRRLRHPRLRAPATSPPIRSPRSTMAAPSRASPCTGAATRSR